MAADAQFLSDLPVRRSLPPAQHSFRPAGLFLGQGAHGLEVAAARSANAPTRSSVLECWKTRKGGRAAPVLLVVLHPRRRRSLRTCRRRRRQSIKSWTRVRSSVSVARRSHSRIDMRHSASCRKRCRLWKRLFPASTTKGCWRCTSCSMARRSARTGPRRRTERGELWAHAAVTFCARSAAVRGPSRRAFKRAHLRAGRSAPGAGSLHRPRGRRHRSWQPRSDLPRWRSSCCSGRLVRKRDGSSRGRT